MSAPKKHADKGMPWVKLYTAFLGDDDLLDAGDIAQLVALKCIVWTADQGTSGHIPSAPHKVQRFAHLEGGVPAAKAAIEALLAARFLVPTEDPDQLLIRSFSRYQTDLGGSATRKETATVQAFARRHKAGEHAPGTKNGGPAGYREGCPFCADGTPHGAPDAADAPAVPQEPTSEMQGTLDVAVTAALSTSLLEKELKAAFPIAFDSMPRMDAYRQLLGLADELGTTNAHLSPAVRGTLMNAVLGDALTHYLGDTIMGATFTACYNGAKALDAKDGYYWWLLAAQAGATEQFENSKHAIAWLRTVAARKRSEWLGGAA